MMTSICLKMLCQLLMMLTFCLLFANSTDPYDSDGRINGSGYENFSADDLKDINGGHDDAAPNTTSNSQNVVSFEPEASSSSNHFERPPATSRDNQPSGTYSNDAENDADLNRALEESEKEALNKAIEESKKEYEKFLRQPKQTKRSSSMKAIHSSDKQYKDTDKHSSSPWKKITRAFSTKLLLGKSSEPKTKSDSSKPNLSRSKSMAHHGGTSSAKKVPHKRNKEAKKPTK